MLVQKTNAMRILDKNKINYEVITYDISDDKIDGVSVAEKTGQNLNEVYKTLVTIGDSREIYVFVIPVSEELNLKKAAKACCEKKVQMIQVKDITKYTGYVRGGCSPIGMKKEYKTYVQFDGQYLTSICISGGKKGLQIKLLTEDLISIVKGEYEELTN